MNALYNKVNFLFNGTPYNIMVFLSLLPLLTINNPYIFSINSMTINLDILFFIYFLIKFIGQFNNRELNGVFLYLDIIALLSFLPYFNIFRLLLLTRLFSMIFRFQGVSILVTIIKENAFLFKSVVYLCLIYMFITSTIVFNIEPSTFDNNYFYAFYWSGVTLTTVGYGDIYPITQIGQTIALISSFLGIGIIALPSAIISSNFFTKIQKLNIKNDQK